MSPSGDKTTHLVVSLLNTMEVHGVDALARVGDVASKSSGPQEPKHDDVLRPEMVLGVSRISQNKVRHWWRKNKRIMGANVHFAKVEDAVPIILLAAVRGMAPTEGHSAAPPGLVLGVAKLELLEALVEVYV